MSRKCNSCDEILCVEKPYHTKFCSNKCRARWNKKFGGKAADGHICRNCGTLFPIGKGQNNKWLCSKLCQKSSNAKSVREFHKRKPEMEKIYRERTREKQTPDSVLKRFYSWNPSAPTSCESCAEHRVLEIAHKPQYQRFGERRKKDNCRWPQMVWVLCPTCHELLDRMNYSPSELNLI